MSQNGNGYNGRYTAGQFIQAIPGTGGVISTIAAKCGCAWNTARDAIDRWPTVKQAWENERAKVTDVAQSNVISAIVDKKDLATSKWWLQLMDPTFTPKEERKISTDGEMTFRVVYERAWDDSAEGAA